MRPSHVRVFFRLAIRNIAETLLPIRPTVFRTLLVASDLWSDCERVLSLCSRQKQEYMFSCIVTRGWAKFFLPFSSTLVRAIS